MPNCTIIREAAWQTKQTAFAAFDFAKDEAQCFFTTQGQPIQLAMTLTKKATGRTRTVITEVDDEGFWFWLIVR